MKIKSAEYINDDLLDKKNVMIKATIDDVEMFVPVESNNRHFQAIQEWVKEGNTIEEAE
tara:strand:- start:1304 stop:1480 length:177 start_codon:yes stop_codon:yes gene_type:complete